MKPNYFIKVNLSSRLVSVALLMSIFIGATAADRIPSLQSHRVTGLVTSASEGIGLPGVSIVVKGTTTGTVTDQDGRYSIIVSPDDILVFSFVGYESHESPVGGRNTIDVMLKESLEALDEVVVTALGIQRSEKSLGYSVANVAGDELTRVAQENFLSGMAGKVAGVTINSTGGPGSTVSIVIRGATSLSTDNQPLFVVDGVPMNNSFNNVGGFGRDNRVDYGNAIADLDPESIESVTVLKGPSAAALYGTRAGNGVILITTKKAKEGQGLKVSVSTNTVFDLPVRYINTQKKFSRGVYAFRPEDVGSGILPPLTGETGGGPETDKGYWAVQWHSPLDANGQPVPIEIVSYKDNMKNFINDYAFTTTNSVQLSNATERIQYRLGVTNMNHTGLIPNSDLTRNNISLSASSKVHEKVTVSTDFNFVNGWADNRPASNRGTNPLQHAMRVPLNININDLRDYNRDNNYNRISSDFENPWVIANEVNNSFNRYQVFGNISATWQITPHLSLMGRMTLNKSDQVQETKIGLGYWDEPNNGAYGISTSNHMERNMDVLATYRNEWEDFSLSVSAGANSLYSRNGRFSNASKPGSGLIVPNLFTVSNIPSAALDYQTYESQRGINSVYATANLGWRDIVYLDLTGRNDWSSTLPAANRSYFYPSASLSVILNEIVDMGNSVDMVKLRGGWAQVGNDTDPYRLTPVYQNVGQWGDAIRLSKQSGLLSPNLLPEKATSFEVGPEVRLLGDRLRFEATYYRVDNRNQILGVPLAASSGFGSVQINAGLLRSEGVELVLGVTPIRTADWTLDLTANFTKNDTRILELSEGIDFVDFWDEARVRNIGYVKNEAMGHNGRIGNLYSRRPARVKDPTSPYYRYPLIQASDDWEWYADEEWSLVGNYNPDFIVGLQTSLSYKNFSLNMTFDWRKGGQYVSQTARYLSEWFISGAWLDNLVVPPEGLRGELSDELRDWVVANADKLLFTDRVRPIGGPTPEYGGFPNDHSTIMLYNGTLTPGVVGYHDEDGKFVLVGESLGNPGSLVQPYGGSYPWDIGQSNMFDADYIKLREVSLGYRLPKSFSQKIGMDDINVAVYSRNIMLWTKDPSLGIDPEKAYQPEASGTLRQGIERFNALPWVVPVGFKVNLTF